MGRPSCFETHRNAFEHEQLPQLAGVAMLLSMRPAEESSSEPKNDAI
jgi:hypothetical protein